MAKLRYRTLRENVVDEIRMKILNREYEPGMRIVEQNLSDELGVSQGPNQRSFASAGTGRTRRICEKCWMFGQAGYIGRYL